MSRRETALAGLLLAACNLPNPTFVLATDSASSGSGQTTTASTDTPDPTTGAASTSSDLPATGDPSTTHSSDGETDTSDTTIGESSTGMTSEPLTSGSTTGTSDVSSTTDTTTGEPQLELPNCDPSDSSLLACYDFEYELGVMPTELIDSSMYGHDGKVDFAAPIQGIEGTALEILGESKILVTPTLAFNYPTNALTITAWVRPSDALRNLKYIGVLDKGLDFGLGLVSGGELACRVGQASIEKIVELPLGLWTHLACTYNGGDMALYIDGVEVSTSTAADVEFNASPAKLAIGCGDQNCDTATRFPGAIDGVRIWNAALKPLRICAEAGKQGC